MAFPTNPINGQYYKTPGGKVFKYSSADLSWSVVEDLYQEALSQVDFDFRGKSYPNTTFGFKSNKKRSSDTGLVNDFNTLTFSQSFVATTSQTDFNLSQTITDGNADGIPDGNVSVFVYDNGTLVAQYYKGSDIGTLTWGTDIALQSSGTVLQFATGRTSGNTIDVEYYKANNEEDTGILTFADFDLITEGTVISLQGTGVKEYNLVITGGVGQLQDEGSTQLGTDITLSSSNNHRASMSLVVNGSNYDIQATIDGDTISVSDAIDNEEFIGFINFFVSGEYLVNNINFVFSQNNSILTNLLDNPINVDKTKTFELDSVFTSGLAPYSLINSNTIAKSGERYLITDDGINLTLPTESAPGDNFEVKTLGSGTVIDQDQPTHIINWRGQYNTTMGNGGSFDLSQYDSARFIRKKPYSTGVFPPNDEGNSPSPMQYAFENAWSPNGNYVARATVVEPFLQVYDMQTGYPVYTADPDVIPLDIIHLSWSPNGQYIVVATIHREKIHFYDMSSGSPVHVTTIDGSGIWGYLLFSPVWSVNDIISFTTENSPYIYFYNWNSGSPTKITDPSTLPPTNSLGLEWSLDGRYLSAGFDYASSPYLMVYDLNSGTPVNVTGISANAASIRKPTWSSSGRYLSAAYERGSINCDIWDWNTGSPVKLTINNELGSYSGNGAKSYWSADESYVLVVGAQTINLINVSGTTATTIALPQINDITTTNLPVGGDWIDNNYFLIKTQGAASSGDQREIESLYIYNINGGSPILIENVADFNQAGTFGELLYSCVSFSPDKSQVFTSITTGLGPVTVLYNVSGTTLTLADNRFKAYKPTISNSSNSSIVFDPYLNTYYIIYNDNSIFLQSFSSTGIQTLSQINTVPLFPNPYGLTVSPNQKYIAWGSSTTSDFAVFDITDPQNPSAVSISPNVGFLASMVNAKPTAWSLDSRFLAITGKGGENLNVYDFQSGSPVKTNVPSNALSDSSYGCSVGWLSGNVLVQVNYSSTTMKLWDFSTGQPVELSNGPATSTSSIDVGFSPVGDKFFGKNLVFSWDGSTVTNIATLANSVTSSGQHWSPTGKFLMYFSTDNSTFRILETTDFTTEVYTKTFTYHSSQVFFWVDDFTFYSTLLERSQYLNAAHNTKKYTITQTIIEGNWEVEEIAIDGGIVSGDFT